MGSYDGAEICELVGIYILSSLTTIIHKTDIGLYRDDGLLVLRYMNGQQIDRTRKNIIKIFKNIGFKIEIETNLKVADFLDITFNLTNSTFRPYKKPNDSLLYINKMSNHPPQILAQIPKIINGRLSRNSSNEEVFNMSKEEYQKSLKYIHLKFNKVDRSNQKRKRKRNIIWFNPPYSQEVATNVGKKFLQLLDLHFPRSSNLRKIFNRNTVKVSYSCTKNIGRIIKSHNHKLLNPADENPFPCNCKNKAECPLEGKCKAQSIVYKCVVSAANHQDKVYLGTSEGEFKQRYYNHKKSFNNKRYWKDTTLSKYIWDLKEKSNVTPTLKWSIAKSVPSYSNITKRCLLCLEEKYEILNYPQQHELLNRRSELISKCRHANKYLLANYKSND